MSTLGIRIDPAIRFWAKVRKTDDCWIWTAYIRPSGYGEFCRRGREGSILSHRWAWEEANGPIPKGLFVCHHCDTPACVRPSHLFLGTARDNSHDAKSKGRLRGRFTGSTICIHGHPLSGENIAFYKGHRRCLVCQYRTRQRHWDRHHPNAVKRGPRKNRLPSRARRGVT